MPLEGDASVYMDAGIWSGRDEGEYAALKAATCELQIDAESGRFPPARVIGARRACRAVGPEALATDPRVDLLRGLDLQNVYAFPVFVGDDVAAVLEFFASTDDEPDDGLINMMTHVGMQLSRVIERRRMQNELADAVWDQQREFGQELHDTVGQELTGIAMLADSLARKLAAREASETEAVRELADMLQHAKQGVRRLAKGLLPVEVDADGLKAALEELAETTEERCGITVDVWCDERLKLTDNMVATHLFRIAQEAVTNAVRHAHAHHLALRFARNDDGDVELSVSDDGLGMPIGGRRPGQGVGLQIMKYRAQVIDADFEIHPGLGGGTVVACRLRRSTSHVSDPGRLARQCAHRG
jgi:signal transduction histidine kinase